jgi:hypothetical protein
VVALRLLRLLSDTIDGLTIAGLLAWLAAPFLRRDRVFVLLWLATLVSLVALAVITGGKLTDRHLLPITTPAFVLGCVPGIHHLRRVPGRRDAQRLLPAVP